jgi:DNA-binding response OmpR family regulator
MEFEVATILLVDDDQKILEPLKLVLEAEGYHVFTATNGEAALGLVASAPPSLVVTDWMMPCVDGVGLCQRLKTGKATSRIPVILLSAASPPHSTEPLWDVELMKPVSIARLLGEIRTLLIRR